MALGMMIAGLAMAGPAGAQDTESSFVTGDGIRFSLPLVNGMPGRAENEVMTWELAGFDTDIQAAPQLIDRFVFVFRSNAVPRRLRIEDVTLGAPVLIADVAVPEKLPSAGFRRSRFEFRAAPCAIAHGEPCSAWMFGEQPHRLYRATATLEDGSTSVLHQAEPYQMAAFIARLGDRIPDHRGESQQRTAQGEQP
ncbi:hypothetical protein [Silanimonas lenta]|uniref:hypothetical protein n=1 Tax=Silanimonas lenta TaxID=265429 RepID=UPI0012EB1CB4|nr:hypothetical protein [Silanimonas lenta]